MRMNRILGAVLVLLLPAIAWAGEAALIGQEAFLEKVSSGGGDLVILDVRSAKEFAEGHVPGARNISQDELEARLGELEAARDREVVVYCRSGRRSEIALDLLQKAGFTRLYHLEGDYLAWSAAGKPVGKLDGVPATSR